MARLDGDKGGAVALELDALALFLSPPPEGEVDGRRPAGEGLGNVQDEALIRPGRVSAESDGSLNPLPALRADPSLRER